MKRLFWIGSSREDLKQFPGEVQDEMGVMKKKIIYEESSGNVFADLGVENPEEALAKSELARQISKLIKKKKLTQKQAAEILGIDQPKISALIRGRLRSFSLERLIRFLNELGQDVSIMISPARLLV